VRALGGANDSRARVNAAKVMALFGEDVGAMIGLAVFNPIYARG